MIRHDQEQCCSAESDNKEDQGYFWEIPGSGMAKPGLNWLTLDHRLDKQLEWPMTVCEKES